MGFTRGGPVPGERNETGDCSDTPQIYMHSKMVAIPWPMPMHIVARP